MRNQNELFISDANVVEPSSGCNRISELSIPVHNAHSPQLLLTGILRELNDTDDNRWVCWVADTPVKSFLSERARRNGQHLLQVLPRHGQNTLGLAIRALLSGRSHTVVVMLSQSLSTEEYRRLENAAICGQAECLIIRQENLG